MNWDIVKGNLEQVKGKLKEKYGDLTDDEIMQMEGSADQMSGKLQEKYGISKQEAEDTMKELEKSLNK